MSSVKRLTALAVLPLVGVLVGAAASLGLTSTTLGAARTATPRCTAAALSVIQNLTGSNVSSVTVSTLPAACGGATLQLTVNNGSTNASGSAAVPAGGGSVTVTLGTAVALGTKDQVDLVLVGP